MKKILICCSLILLISCGPAIQARNSSTSGSEPDIRQWAQKIAQQRKQPFIRIKDKKFRNDCSNFVRAVYYGATGKDLFQEAVDKGIYKKVKREEVFGSSFGVVLLYILMRHEYRISSSPRVGDIVFFDRTYDKNRNKKIEDDILTHTGVVINVDSDETVTFVHAGTSKGITVGYLNRKNPDQPRKEGKVINSYLQRKYSWNRSPAQLTGRLVRGFGRVF
jgi:hypothetical protein